MPAPNPCPALYFHRDGLRGEGKVKAPLARGVEAELPLRHRQARELALLVEIQRETGQLFGLIDGHARPSRKHKAAENHHVTPAALPSKEMQQPATNISANDCQTAI